MLKTQKGKWCIQKKTFGKPSGSGGTGRDNRRKSPAENNGKSSGRKNLK